MTIKEIVQELETAEKPVAKLLRKGEAFNVLAIGFKKGMVLNKHKSNVPARLVVIKGEMVYNNEIKGTTVALYEEYEIPVDEIHWVEAKQDSIVLVIKGIV